MQTTPKNLCKSYARWTTRNMADMFDFCFSVPGIKNVYCRRKNSVVTISLYQLFSILCKSENNKNHKLYHREPLKDFLVSCKKWLEFVKLNQHQHISSAISKKLKEIDQCYTTAKIMAVKFDQIFDSVFPDTTTVAAACASTSFVNKFTLRYGICIVL